MDDEQRDSVRRGLLLGLGINLAVTVALIAPLAMWQDGAFHRFIERLALTGSATGATQLIWILPLARNNYHAGRSATAKGLIRAAVVTAVVNAVAWVVLIYLFIFHSHFHLINS